MLLTNDLTEEVMDEAEERGVNFILSYHPPVFRPLKRITSNAWKVYILKYKLSVTSVKLVLILDNSWEMALFSVLRNPN